MGHLLLDENNSNNDFLKEDLKHETVGFKYLCKNFNEGLLSIMYHVLMKDIYVQDNNYYESLSNASKKVLKFKEER